ncbi:MAG: class I SAM-dependent methyltransferase [Capsulimonas sp.]|uniref:class I SAM-dependent methyltransferase n=1 Tax=Capsulimonas sp. TaxID=2494211 RepID=UPI0032678F65
MNDISNTPSSGNSLTAALQAALAARTQFLDARHEMALRLFNGFYEGFPNLVVDLYGRTLIVYNYAHTPSDADDAIGEAFEFFQEALPWVTSILVKARYGALEEEKKGRLLWGSGIDKRIRENGVAYAVDLRINQDASFYLDTRHLREWAKDNLEGKTVLNTFAYTGSIGIAARAGGASRVVQIDLSRTFLNVAKESCTINGFSIDRLDFQAGDFFPRVSHLKRDAARFDCVFVDPPLYSKTRGGKVDLMEESHRILNKVRPLINDGGWLVTINNALFVSGAEYMAMLESLCADGYLSIETTIPVPQDFIGFSETPAGVLPADPAPFNHATKIAVLRVRRKDAIAKPTDES